MEEAIKAGSTRTTRRRADRDATYSWRMLLGGCVALRLVVPLAVLAAAPTKLPLSPQLRIHASERGLIRLLPRRHEPRLRREQGVRRLAGNRFRSPACVLRRGWRTGPAQRRDVARNRFVDTRPFARARRARSRHDRARRRSHRLAAGLGVRDVAAADPPPRDNPGPRVRVRSRSQSCRKRIYGHRDRGRGTAALGTQVGGHPGRRSACKLAALDKPGRRDSSVSKRPVERRRRSSSLYRAGLDGPCRGGAVVRDR